jgi:outer membrane protein OmpA-like peptidoglycan-associated protein
MGTKRFYLLFATTAILSLVLCTRAHADSQRFNGNFFEPATGKNAYFMLQSSDTLHNLQFSVGDFFSYGYHPLELRRGASRLRGIIDQLIVSDFNVAFSPMEWLQLGVDFPIILFNKFKSPNDTSAAPLENHFSIGDTRFEAKFRVLNPYDKYIGLAFVPFVTIPTGQDKYYVADPGFGGGLKIVVEGRPIEHLLLTLNAGFRGGKKILLRNVEYQYRMIIAGGASYFFNNGINVFGEVDALSPINNFFGREESPTEAMLGFNWDIKKSGVSVKAGGGTCLVCGVGGAMASGIVGVSYRYNPPKYQQLDDDITLRYRALFKKNISAADLAALKGNCPDNPSMYREGVDDAACPKYYELREMADLVIRCPPSPEMYDPKIHDASCPKVFELKDTYSESEIQDIYAMSVSEMGLRCPENPADFRYGVHDSACPKYYRLKEAVGLAEQCPADPREWNPSMGNSACPKFYVLRDDYGADQWATIVKLSKMDSDGDGINDYLDRCPKIPEDKNGIADEDGCPETGPGAVAGGEIQTFKPVYFAFNSTTLTPEAMEGMSQVIKTINQTKWISRVMVAGHADARGTEAANQMISMKRAQVVIDYLQHNGVRPGVDMAPIGEGAAKPAAPNDSEENRAKNRRVVFNIPQYRYLDYRPPTEGRPASAIAVPAEREVAPAESKPPPSRWQN